MGNYYSIYISYNNHNETFLHNEYKFRYEWEAELICEELNYRLPVDGGSYRVCVWEPK